ncbi:MAG: alkyl hydroperoxide reductase [Dehalococcoidales bacterium]|nr:alkyl hydroperoxide reductase [Dehalococcoidales bacterium]
MHMLPQLRRLEERYPDVLVVVGVHSGKFHAERLTANIRQAVLRLEIEHPVVNDRYFRIWRAYGVSAWPTVALIDPAGNYAGSHPGEITAEALDPVIRKMVDNFSANGRSDRRPLHWRLEKESAREHFLSFPGKVHASSGDDRLFVSDTGQNRVLAVRLTDDGRRGRVEQVAGSAEPGLRDGALAEARFNHPQGLAFAGGTLYVADTENHAIRAVDLAGGTVRTLAGTGQQARGLQSGSSRQGVALSSPWDVLVRGDTLYIAMAGIHQLWTLSLATGEVGPFAGSGLEDLQDGPAGRAALAQPTGLTADEQRLYFADSESSSIRWVDLGPDGSVHTIVGTGLFDFGDTDGAGNTVSLQHAYGLVAHEGRLYVADTYNNKIKVVDPAARTSLTLFGEATAGFRDGESPLFYEPEGITVKDGRLYVADTNNHCIRVVDLRSGLVSTLTLGEDDTQA